MQMVIKDTFAANDSKNLDIKVSGQTYRRYPIQTKSIMSSDKLTPIVTNHLKIFLTKLQQNNEHAKYLDKDWTLYISEKIVAITQGRSFLIKDIKPSFSARLFSRFVVKTPYGIGLASPYTMQLAIKEVGLVRIVLASAASVIGKVLGKKGWFYIVAGSDVRAIDGPTDYSVYPSNVSAKLAPKDPDLVAKLLSQSIKKEIPDILTKNFKGVVVIDANDLGCNVLGHDTNQSNKILEEIFSDNPLGQGHEHTPLCVVFKC